MADGQVVFEIEGDTRGIKSSLKETTSLVDKESSKWESALKKISIAAIAAKAGQALLKLGKDAIQAASDLEEVQNVVDVTFGSSSKQVDAWAKNAIKQFGLTETQAKKFASTIGAMMKSLGVSGTAVTEMSENLAGLAADMASFYNLDFDTAFQKIRSGISGETEPLKQLGINLSAANLEAFALSKGLEKTYKNMSSSEQAMLRYEYLMQATADAQGDFARTTDGLANGSRLLASELEKLKTKVGQPLASAFGIGLEAVNRFISAIFPDETEKRRTILDEINDIQIDTETKTRDIESIAKVARGLIGQLEKIQGKDPSVVVGNIAENANKLNSSSPANWQTILGAFQAANFTGIDGDTGVNVKALADGLSGITASGYESKAEAWKALLGVLGENVGLIAEYTGKEPDDIANFLNQIGTEANGLSDTADDAWDGLLGTLTAYLGQGVIDSATLAALSANMPEIKTAGNELKASTGTNWSNFLTALQGIDGLENVFGEGETAKNNIAELATALSGNGISGSKAAAWNKLIDALLKADSINGLTGDELNNVKTELSDIKEAASGLTEDDVAGWAALFEKLLQVIPGASDTPEGKRMIDMLAEGFGAVSVSAGAAAQAMEYMGDSTGDAAQDEARFWEILRQLTKVIPGLADLIDIENKTIKGGIPALREYVDEWERLNKYKIQRQNLQKEMDILNSGDYQAEAYSVQNKAKTDAKITLMKQGISADRAAEIVEQWSAVGGAAAALDLKNGNQSNWQNMQDLRTESVVAGVSKATNNAIITAGRTFGKDTAIRERAISDLVGIVTDWAKETGVAGYIPLETPVEIVPEIDKENWDYAVESLFASTQYNAENSPYGIEMTKDSRDALLAVSDATYDYVETLYAVDAATKVVAADMKNTENAAKGVAETDKDAADAAALWQDAQVTAANNVTASLQTALDEMEAYYNTVRQGVESTVNGVIKGFDRVQTAAYKASVEAEKMKDKADKDGSYVKGGSDGITYSTMKAGLDSQIQFMQEYRAMLAEAQNLNLDPRLLAELADGSVEAYDYLDALFDFNSDGAVKLKAGVDIDAINERYNTVQELKEGFVDDLTKAQLEVDDGWKEVVKNVEDAVAGLDQSDLARVYTEKTMDAMLEALKKGNENLKTQVFAIQRTLARLSWHGIAVSATGTTSGAIQGMVTLIGSHAGGLDYVPYDGYLAQLHRGESVLTAEEASLYRNNKPAFSYDGISGAVWSNAPKMGGDVYLDGRVVGKIISDRQGNEFRAMERSGWRG
jgi:hypothetical protein